MSTPLPGWYPDSDDPQNQRFWDGQEWTEDRSYPAPTTAAPAIVGAVEPVAPDEPQPPKWVWILILTLVILTFLGVVFLMIGSFDNQPAPASSTPIDTPTVTATTTATVTATTTQTTAATPSAVPTPTPTPTPPTLTPTP